MKSRLLSLFTFLLLVFSLSSTETKANHGAGGEIIYEWLQDSTYRVFFKFYRDCGGPPAPVNPTPNLCYYSSCVTGPAGQFSKPMDVWPGQIPPGVDNGSPVTLGCSGSSTECSTPRNPDIPGVEEWWYYAIVELPWRCNFWTFSADIQVRNASNNLVGMPNFYVETTYNNQYGQGFDQNGKAFGNSSPYFDAKPIPYTCQNMPMFFNNDARDPNVGDSLVTEIVFPLTGNCGGVPTPMTLNNTPSTFPLLTIPTNPFQTNNSFVLNAQTGQMSFTATDKGPQTLAVKVKEYRNGVLLGSILRDVQIQVLDPSLCNYTPSTINPGLNVDGAYLDPTGQMQACQDQEMKFCFDIATADPVGVLFVRDNSPTANQLAGMNVTYTGQGGKTVRGCVKWTPKMNQRGLRNLLITVKDSTCHPPGIVFTQFFSVPIFVHGPTTGFKDSSLCPGDQMVLNVQGGGNFQWTEVGGGSTSTMSCSNCQNPTITPYSSLKYAVVSNATTFCNNNKDTIEITMLPTPIFDKQPDFTLCPGNQANYDLKVQTPPGETTTVTWTPTTYLNTPGIQNPVSNPLNDVKYFIEIKNSGNRCKSFDTSEIIVLDGFAIETPDTAICLGAPVDVRAIGDPGYTYFWKALTPALNTISDPTLLNPTITPGEARTIVFELRASRPGCKDSVAKLTIDAQPNPTVVVNDDFSICYGDTIRMSSTILPPYDKYKLNWTPGAALDNSNARNPIFLAFEDGTLQLEVSTPAGCKGTDEVKIDVLPADFLVISEDMAICPGETADLTLTGTNVVKMWWDENSPYMNDRASWNPKVSPVVTHTYRVYGIDIHQCRDTQDVKVTVKPAAVVTLPDTIKLFPGENFRMNPKGNALRYNWFPHVGLNRPDISDPLVRPTVNTRYFVTATTEAGCQTTDSVDVFVQSDSYLEIPNVFAPGRGANGVFKVLHIGEASLVKFTVFNRWGTKMFETSNISEGWDGRYNGQAQPMGVYMYTIEAKTATGKTVTKQGNVTMIR